MWVGLPSQPPSSALKAYTHLAYKARCGCAALRALCCAVLPLRRRACPCRPWDPSTLHTHSTPPCPPSPPPPRQVNFLLVSSFGIILPIRLYLPAQLPFLLLLLRATAQRCRQECGLKAWAGAAGACIAGAAAADGTCVASSSAAAAGVAADAASFEAYYEWVAAAIRRINLPALARLPTAWRPGGSADPTCLGSCFAVHAWLQVGGGGRGRCAGVVP